jgi:hypothetical protein
MKNVTIVAVAMLLIGAVVGAGVAWQYRQGEVDEAFSAGMAYYSGIAPSTTTPASMSFALNTSTFNMTAVVDADGGVTTESAVTRTITITNSEESGGRTASNLYLTLWNPVTDRDGLHDNLETSYTDVYVTIGGVTRRLYTEGEYIGKDTSTPGISVGSLGPKDSMTITFVVDLEECVAGTFQDSESVTNSLYLYQPNAQYCDVLTFTIST